MRGKSSTTRSEKRNVGLRQSDCTAKWVVLGYVIVQLRSGASVFRGRENTSNGLSLDISLSLPSMKVEDA